MKRIYSFDDIRKNFPDLYNRIKGYVLLAGVLNKLKIEALRLFVTRLQGLLKLIGKSGNDIRSSIADRFKSINIKQSRPVPAQRIDFTDMKVSWDEFVKSLQQLVRDMIRAARSGFVVELANLAMNLLNGRANADVVRQAAVRVEGRIFQMVRDALRNLVNSGESRENMRAPKPRPGTFEDIIKKDFLKFLGLGKEEGEKFIKGMSAHCENVYDRMFDIMADAGEFYKDTYNETAQNCFVEIKPSAPEYWEIIEEENTRPSAPDYVYMGEPSAPELSPDEYNKLFGTNMGENNRYVFFYRPEEEGKFCKVEPSAPELPKGTCTINFNSGTKGNA